MKNCQFEKYLLPWLLHEISEPDKNRLQLHLESCASCRQQLAELQDVDLLLSDYKRQPVQADIYRAYQKQLAVFQPTPVWVLVWAWLKKAAAAIFVTRSLAFRLARTFAVLMIGVLIGYIIFQPESPTRDNLVAIEQAPQTLSKEDIQFISDYFVKSELLLLTIANSPMDEPTDDDISLNKDIAKNLLYKSAQVQRKATALDDEVILTFLNHLELVLLEISNRDEDEVRATFRDIREMVKEADMIQSSRRLQQRLEKSLLGSA